MTTPQSDHDVLADALSKLLQGELRIDFKVVSLGKALGRCGKDSEWVVRGLARWLSESEEALPLVAAALTQEGAARLREYLQAKYPADSAKPADDGE